MSCDESNCDYCCIPNDVGELICATTLHLCRFKSTNDFYKLYVIIIYSISFFFIFPMLYKVFEFLMLKSFFKNKSFFQLLRGLIKKKEKKEIVKRKKKKLFVSQKIFPRKSTFVVNGGSIQRKKQTIVNKQPKKRATRKFLKDDSVIHMSLLVSNVKSF